jgi:hypothetical protein
LKSKELTDKVPLIRESVVRLRLVESWGEEHEGEEEGEGDAEEEALVLMETGGSSLQSHEALLH